MSIAMKKFTESDWDAYYGCDSDEPKVGYMLLKNPAANVEWESEVIQDGKVVQIITLDENRTSNQEIWFHRKFKNKDLAIQWLQDSDAERTVRDLINNGFETSEDSLY